MEAIFYVPELSNRVLGSHPVKLSIAVERTAEQMINIFEKLFSSVDSEENPEIVIISPENDGESVAIVELCKRARVKCLVTNQAWGASWEALEEGIKEKIISSENTLFYGVELQGEAPSHCVNVDHHFYTYSDCSVDDRRNPKSSIEQVADLLKVSLNVSEMFISENDKNFIPGMERLGVKLGMSKAVTALLIQETRSKDRAAQGITPKQEAIAEEAIANREVIGDLTIVEMSHSKCATVTDRLYGQYKNLLVYTPGEELNFYGDWASVEEIRLAIPGGWSGNGSWGISDGSPEMFRRVKGLLTSPDWEKRVGRRKGMIAMAFK